MLDIVENDLLKKHLPGVTYLRLDGSIPASSRHQIVTKFNGDPSIDVLLLTTQVSGTNLNRRRKRKKRLTEIILLFVVHRLAVLVSI